MTKLFVFIRRVAVWLWRIRHRCGYGIHSPFAFSFVTGVVYERGVYYAYAPLHALRQKTPGMLREKDDRLLFRLINASGARTALVCGDSLETTLFYLQAGRKTADMQVVSGEDMADVEVALRRWPDVDFVYMDVKNGWPEIFKRALEQADERAMLVVRGIHRDKKSLAAWRSVIADSRLRVTFDLYDFGIAFTEARFNKEHYVVNYF